MKRSHAFFSEEEKNRLEEAVRAVECCTIGEVAVMVVDRSDDYREAGMLGSVLVSALVSFILTELFLDASLTLFIPLCVLFFFPSALLFAKVPALKTAFISRRRIEEAVRDRAVRAFFQRGLYRTKDNTGVLFFLSVLERKVWVLADKGIYAKIDQETLNRFASAVSQGVREGRACDALCGAIRDAGEMLARHFPVTPKDTDELSNKVMIE